NDFHSRSTITQCSRLGRFHYRSSIGKSIGTLRSRHGESASKTVPKHSHSESWIFHKIAHIRRTRGCGLKVTERALAAQRRSTNRGSEHGTGEASSLEGDPSVNSGPSTDL